MVEPAALWADGIPVRALSAQTSPPPRDPSTRFWATPPRAQTDPTREVLEISFSGQRLINYVSIEIARYPSTVTCEFYDPDVKVWMPVLDGNGLEIVAAVTDSRPSAIITTGTGTAPDPQHTGKNHWMHYSWRVRRTTAQRFRFVFTRSPGIGPLDQTSGLPVKYSLGARNIDMGYRIYSKADIPARNLIQTEDNTFASSTDFLGSRVEYVVRTMPASAVLDPTIAKPGWKSEPQPFGYAVVNFFADVRDDSGEPQIIDRFQIDPITVGPRFTLYYSEDEPDADRFAPDNDPLVYPVAQETGTNWNPTWLDMTASPAMVDIKGAAIQWRPTKPWWFALYGDFLDDIADPSGDHPIFDFGGNVLRFYSGQLQFITSGGEVIDWVLPGDTPNNATVSLVFGLTPNEDGSFTATAGVKVAQSDPYYFTGVVQQGITATSELRLGGYFSGSTASAGMRLRAMLLKQEAISQGGIDDFFAEPQQAPLTPDVDDTRPDQTINALLRFHPSGLSQTYPTGMVGGPGYIYDDLTWTPIALDFTLKKGFVEFPAVRAKFFKFEFTNLVPQQYEVFVPVNRKVKVFSTKMVERFLRVGGSGGGSPSQVGPGYRTAQDVGLTQLYSDALNALIFDTPYDGNPPTAALAPTNPVTHSIVRDTSWVWNFEPWQVSGSGGKPRFEEKGKHYYQTITVRHKTKIAYFVGIKSLQPYRLSYTNPDDTPRYETRFLEPPSDPMSQIAASSNLAFGDPGISTPPGSEPTFAEATSVILPSTRAVRAVQFASAQTGETAIMDDDLTADVSQNWTQYGDANITPLSAGGVLVERGWTANTYAMLETVDFDGDGTPGLYTDLEARGLYGNVEGSLLPNAFVGGGMTSRAETPSAAGRIYAVVQVSSDVALNAPVVVQIIGAASGTIFAETDANLAAGMSTEITAAYTPGSASAALTWGDMESYSYGELDDTTYGSHENVSISEDVQVRVLQRGATQDTFTVNSVRLLDDPVSWAFSNDGGVTWWDAPDIRNDPNGVLTLPPVPPRPTPSSTGDDPVTDSDGNPGTDHWRGYAVTWLGGPLTLVAPNSPNLSLANGQRVIRRFTLMPTTITDPATGVPLLQTFYDSQTGSSGAATATVAAGTYTMFVEEQFSSASGAPEPVWLWPDPPTVDGLAYTAMSTAGGNQLRWRLRIYRQGVTVSALAIRPWYLGFTTSMPTRQGMSVGPNLTPGDLYGPITTDPMWQLPIQRYPAKLYTYRVGDIVVGTQGSTEFGADTFGTNVYGR